MVPNIDIDIPDIDINVENTEKDTKDTKDTGGDTFENTSMDAGMGMMMPESGDAVEYKGEFSRYSIKTYKRR